MSESTHPFTAMTCSREDAYLFPEISSSINESANLLPDMTNSVNESSNLFEGMKSRLYMAAEEGNVDELDKFIEGEEKHYVFKAFTGLGNSVLHIAVCRGHLRFIERLLIEVNKDLDAGSEFVMAKNSDGNSALHLAAVYGYHELVEKFLKLKDRDVEAVSIESQKFKVLMSQNREGNTVLHEAARGGNYKVVEVLLNHVSPHLHDLACVSNVVGETALFIACQCGHTNIAERLLDFIDTKSNMKRRDGQTPLHSAVLYGHTGVVEKLLQGRPDLTKQTDVCGRTAMHMLALSSSFPGKRDINMIAGLLLAKDNSLCYIQDKKRPQTPLHMAVEWEAYDLVDILLVYGRDCVEAIDKDGRKPLHLAVINTKRAIRATDLIEVYQFKNMLLSLISKESLNHRDTRGRTALEIAAENLEKDSVFHGSIMQMLRMNGAMVTPEVMDKVRNISPAKTWIKAQNVSINAVLIATVSFAAAFTLPGGLISQPGQKPKAVFIDDLLFKLFVICDTFSFCSSIVSVILVQHAEQHDQQDRPQVFFSINLLWSALMSLVVAFGAALHLVITPPQWLAGIVWTLVCLVPIGICVARVRSRAFLAVPERDKIWAALGIPLLRAGWLLLAMLDILNIFAFGGPLYMVLWIKNSWRMAKIRKRIHRFS